MVFAALIVLSSYDLYQHDAKNIHEIQDYVVSFELKAIAIINKLNTARANTATCLLFSSRLLMKSENPYKDEETLLRTWKL